MSNLYEIKASLERLFEDIEEEGGVITDEQIQLLQIKEEELKNKLEQYVKAVQVYNSNVDQCKTEEKRIKQRRDIYNKRVDCLKKIILSAVEQFGRETKTNKVIELPTFRLSTRATQSVELDEDRVRKIIIEFERFITELVHNGVLTAGKDIDLDGFVASMNANLKAEYGDDFEDITVDDLRLIKVNINMNASLEGLLLENEKLLNLYGECYAMHMDSAPDKTFIKNELPFAELNTVAKFNNYNTLTIK